MKILFVNYSLNMGGIASSLNNLLKELSKEPEIDIFMIVLNSGDAFNREVPNGIKIVELPHILQIQNMSKKQIFSRNRPTDLLLYILFRTSSKLFGKKRFSEFLTKYVQILGHYDIAISFANDIYNNKETTCGCNDIVLNSIHAAKKIAWIHNDARRLNLTYEICKKTYSDFDLIVNVSLACKRIFDDIIPEYSQKSTVAYNLIDNSAAVKSDDYGNPYNNKKFNLITVARLSNEQKRIDRIIDCCKIMKENGVSNFEWHVVGDGPDFEYLNDMARKKDVLDVLIFEGRKNNPRPYIKYADIFVQTSDYEAYSMVLIETLSAGTPIICTEYDSAEEIVLDGLNGFITKMDVYSIFNTIRYLMENKSILLEMRNFISKHENNNYIPLQQFKEIISI